MSSCVELESDLEVSLCNLKCVSRKESAQELDTQAQRNQAALLGWLDLPAKPFEGALSNGGAFSLRLLEGFSAPDQPGYRPSFQLRVPGTPTAAFDWLLEVQVRRDAPGLPGAAPGDPPSHARLTCTASIMGSEAGPVARAHQDRLSPLLDKLCRSLASK